MAQSPFNLVEFLAQHTPYPKAAASYLNEVFGNAQGAAYVVQHSAFKEMWGEDIFEEIGASAYAQEEYFEREDIRRTLSAVGVKSGKVDYAELMGASSAFQTGEGEDENPGYGFFSGESKNSLNPPPTYEWIMAQNDGKWRSQLDWREGATQPQTKGEREQYKNVRFEDITGSRLAGNPDYTQSFSMAAPEAGYVLSPFAKANAAGLTSMGRSAKSGKFVNVKELLPTDAENREILKEVGHFVQRLLNKKYAASNIGKAGMHPDGSNTGTLKSAVASLDITVEKKRSEEYMLNLRLPHKTRPPRHGYDDRVNVRYYGPRVFQGRPGIVSRGAEGGMRFQIRGEWLTTRNVRPSRKDLNIFELTQGERAEVLMEYFRLLKIKMAQRKSETATQPRTE